MKRFLSHILPVISIGLFAFLLYFPVLNYGFHFDDYPFIVQNPAITDLGDLPAIWGSKGARTRFIGWLSFSLNYHVHQLNPFGYHLTNVLIHAVNAVLVYFLVLKILSLRVTTYMVRHNFIALATALLFASHPLQTQAVTYITQRFQSLAVLFYLAALCFYLTARTSHQKRKQYGFFILSAVAGLLGMLTKEVVVTLPLMILLVEVMFLRKEELSRSSATGTAEIKRSRFLPVVLIAVSLMIIPLVHYKGIPRIHSLLSAEQVSESHDGDVITFGKYGLTEFRVLVAYFRLLILPVGQNLDHDFPLSRGFFEPATLFSVILAGALFFLAWCLRKSFFFVSFGIFWILVTFLVEFIPRPHVIFEHKLYLISIGFFMALTAGLASLFKDIKKFVVVMAVVILGLSYLTIQRNKIWTDEVILWNDVVKKSPNKIRPYLNLARTVEKYGRYDIALDCYNKVIALDPGKYAWHNNRGVIHFHLKQFAHALEDYNRSLSLNPYYFTAYINRANLYAALGQYDLALADFDTYLNPALNPHAGHANQRNEPMLYLNRGHVYARMGRYDEAVSDYTKAIETYSSIWNGKDELMEGYRGRADAYKLSRQIDLALRDYHKAIELRPKDGLTYYHRSLAYQDAGKWKEALDDALQARRFGYHVEDEYIQRLYEQMSFPPP